MMFRRRRFADLIERQLGVFAEDRARDLFEDVRVRKALYDGAGRDEAEELYGDYVDAVETATEILADIRWSFWKTLDDDPAEQYEAEFNRAVAKRFPRFGFEIENR